MTEASRVAFLVGEVEKSGEDLCRALVAHGMRVESCRLNDYSAQEISRAVIDAEEKFGAIDTLVYCAAGSDEEWNKMLLDIDEPEWDALVNRRLKGFFLSCKCALPYLVGRESPCIFLLMPEKPLREACGLHEYAADAACRAAVEHMAAELSGYGILVRGIALRGDGNWLGEILERCC